MNDVSVTDRPFAEAMQYALSIIFPEGDKSYTNDFSKMYFGGNHKDSLYFDSDIDVESRSRVSEYVRVLKCIRMVKGFSPAVFEGIAEESGLFLKGNSNGIDFMIYDLESCLSGITNASGDFKGILRAEVHLVRQKTIARFTDTSDIELQISHISAVSDEIILRVFSQVIPRGNFYKKQEACELVRRKVTDPKLCRLMLKLISLIPEKKPSMNASTSTAHTAVQEPKLTPDRTS